MIPKGLLDQAYKSEEHYFYEVSTSTSNIKMISYGIPGYIAIFPQATERQLTNYNQINGGSSNIPAKPSYVCPLGNDYILQNQRDMQTFNNLQYNRNYQCIDYNWWSQDRQNHIPHLPNAELRAPNIQRNIGVTMSEKFYEPQQIIHEHPYEYHQRDLDYKTHISYGYDNSYLSANWSQPPFSKTCYRNQTKYRKEFQQMQEDTIYSKNPYDHDVHLTANMNHSINSTNVTIPKHEEINKHTSDNEPLISYLNFYNTKYKSDDLNTFKKVALDGCLQLKKLLTTNNNKTSGETSELCRSVKSQLSNSMNTIQAELIIPELILGFLHICNSWICISSIITIKQGQVSPYEISLKALFFDFENWQNTSKILLEKLLQTVQQISLEHEHLIKDIYKVEVNSKRSQLEKGENYLEKHNVDLMNLKQQNISMSAYINLGLNTKQTLSQCSEAENCISLTYCEKNDNTLSSNVSTVSAEFQNNKQNFSSLSNQNTAHGLSNTKQQVFFKTRGVFSYFNQENISAENSNNEKEIKNYANNVAQPQKKVSNFQLFQKKHSSL